MTLSSNNKISESQNSLSTLSERIDISPHGKRERLQWVDAAKCIGILMVMFGHNWLDSKFYYYFYAFHMPLFFILAGVTFSVKKNFKTFAWSKFKALMIPYIFFAVCILAFYGILSATHDNSYDITENAYRFLIQDHHTLLWFLAALFLTEIAAYLIVRATQSKFAKYESIILAGMAIVLIVFHYFTVRMGWINLVWVIDLVPICVAFLMIGILYRRFGGESRLESSWLFIAGLFIISLVVTSWNYIEYDHVDMFQSKYGYYPLFIAGALSATWFLFLVLRKVTLPQWLIYIGVYSLIYFGFHRFIIELMFVAYNKVGITVELDTFYGVGLAIINVFVACALIYPLSKFINRRCPWVIGKF